MARRARRASGWPRGPLDGPQGLCQISSKLVINAVRLYYSKLRTKPKAWFGGFEGLRKSPGSRCKIFGSFWLFLDLFGKFKAVVGIFWSWSNVWNIFDFFLVFLRYLIANFIRAFWELLTILWLSLNQWKWDKKSQKVGDVSRGMEGKRGRE